jgi:hypothetical protein
VTYDSEHWGEPVDVVLDAVGGDHLRRPARLLQLRRRHRPRLRPSGRVENHHRAHHGAVREHSTRAVRTARPDAVGTDPVRTAAPGRPRPHSADRSRTSTRDHRSPYQPRQGRPAARTPKPTSSRSCCPTTQLSALSMSSDKACPTARRNSARPEP